MRLFRSVFLISAAILICARLCAQTNFVRKGTIVTKQLRSEILKDNLVGLDTVRKVKVYLPPGYDASKKTYPVIYYFHSIFGNADMILDGSGVSRLLEKAFASNVIKEVIFVVADFSSATTGSLYENSPVSGRWLDYITKELVSFVDANFRTIKNRNSRAITGDFMGGRGALILAMTHADMFGVAYALHPVATGMGYGPWADLGVDWKKIIEAKSYADLGDLASNGRARIFISVCQAFLPNPKRPPFYCDFFMDIENGEAKVNVVNMAKAKKGFLLEENVLESAGNLKMMRGIAYDWARYDGNFDHIHSARIFTRELDDIGVEHEAEEYRGNPWNKVWTDDGRFYSRLLPFVARYLVFE